MNNEHAIEVLQRELERYRWEHSNIDKDIVDAREALERAEDRKEYLDEYLSDLRETVEELKKIEKLVL